MMENIYADAHRRYIASFEIITLISSRKQMTYVILSRKSV